MPPFLCSLFQFLLNESNYKQKSLISKSKNFILSANK